jgi:catechol 2,3-dioxygenase-like lactoylglutathione lyase family enzyme
VRYIVDDVGAAIESYCGLLGFQEVMYPAPTFAMLAADGWRALPQRNRRRDGGRQVLVEDPAGNLVELFQRTRAEARLAR